jgi:hypothetical protein
MVVIERQHEAQLVDPGVARRPQLNGSVRLLPRAPGAAAGERRNHDSVGHAPRRVARKLGGEAK